MRKWMVAALLLFFGWGAHAQEATDSTSNRVWNRIFLPSIDVGYQLPNSDLIGGSVRIGTSIEYRIRNNNDFFVRLNYDTYSAKYNLPNSNTTNTIEGSVQFTDLLLAPGYRLGDNTFRLMFSAMPGVKFYEFPTATIDGTQITVEAKSKAVFTSIFLVTLEYYVDQKSALTLSLFQNQVWKEVDFWENGGSAFGISIGFITALI